MRREVNGHLPFSFLQLETKLELSPALLDQVKSALPTKSTALQISIKNPPQLPKDILRTISELFLNSNAAKFS